MSMTSQAKVPFMDRVKQVAFWIVLVGVGLLVGFYILAPRSAKAQDGYVPRAVVEMPAGVVFFTNPDATSTLLPVRLAETTDARRIGLREVGPTALDTLFLVYVHPRELTRGTYNIEGIRAPLELAVIDAEGKVVAIQRVAPDARTVTVTERHRWVLAAKEGMFAHYGIAVDSILDTENIRKMEFVVAGG